MACSASSRRRPGSPAASTRLLGIRSGGPRARVDAQRPSPPRRRHPVPGRRSPAASCATSPTAPPTTPTGSRSTELDALPLRRARRVGPRGCWGADRCARRSASTSARRPTSSTASPATSRGGSACSPTTRAPASSDARPTAPSCATSSRGGSSSRGSGRGVPVAWRSRTWHEPATRRLRFHHVAGATKGMDVTWTIEPAGDGTPRRDRARLPPAGARVRRLRRPRLHPPDRRPDAGDDQAPSPRPSAPTRP